MDIVFFDLETTGVSIIHDRIIQLSAIKTNENLEIIEKKKVMINPSVSIPKEASDVHGITNEMVKDCPTFEQYSIGIQKFFTGVNLAGYNITYFDVPLLEEELGRCKLSIPINKIFDSCQVFKKRESRTLTDALKFYCDKEMINAHDAEADTLATIDIMKGQLSKYKINLDDIYKESIHPDWLDVTGKLIMKDGVACFNFGKWKDQPIKDHIDYVDWMLAGEFPRNTKNILLSIKNKK